MNWVTVTSKWLIISVAHWSVRRSDDDYVCELSVTSFLMVSSRLSTIASFSSPWRFSCRFSFLLGVYGTKSSSLCRKTTGSSLTQKNMTSCLQKHTERSEIITLWSAILLPLPRANGKMLFSHDTQHMSMEFREARYIILSISFQLGLVWSCCKQIYSFSTRTHDHNFLFA